MKGYTPAGARYSLAGMGDAPADPAAAAPQPKPPWISAPIYIEGRLPPGAAAIAKKAAPSALGVVGVAIVAAVAGYYVPKLLDRFGGSIPDPNHGEDVELQLDGDDG